MEQHCLHRSLTASRDRRAYLFDSFNDARSAVRCAAAIAPCGRPRKHSVIISCRRDLERGDTLPDDTRPPVCLRSGDGVPMTPREMVAAIDWSALPHSYGHSPSVLMVWDAEMERDEAAIEQTDGETLGNLVCHQGTISPAAFALVEPLLFMAKSAHPRRHAAIDLLAWLLSTNGGSAEYRARLHARFGTAPHPFKPGEKMPVPAAPAAEELARERNAIRELRDRVESELELWTALAKDEALDWDVRRASLWVLSRMVHHPDAVEARDLVRQIVGALDKETQSGMSWIIEELNRDAPDGST
ncbi:MAG: hypothetical protein SangKO_079450 [Sandaracinaceae bacterium]